MKELKKIEEKIQNLKKEQLELILSNVELGKFEKLKLIDEYDLFSEESWVQSVFEKLKEEWEKKLVLKHNESLTNIEDFICDGSERERGETINLVHFMGKLYNKHEDLNKEITVLFGIFPSEEYKMKVVDVINYICDWCFENKCTAFRFDW